MPPELTSTRSARVTEIRHLHDRRHRAERGAFVVEGPQAVREALGSGVGELFVAESALGRHADIVEAAREQGARIVTATDDVLAAMAETRQPQGLLAVCPLVGRTLPDVLSEAMRAATPLLVVLDRVSDPGNAGTIIRSADAMGAGGVILTAGSVDPHNGKCVRSTAGSIFHLPIAIGAEPDEVIAACDGAGVGIVLADAHARESLGDRQDYSRAKDEMMVHTDTTESPWFDVEADDKRKARINMIHHLLSTIPYAPVTRPPLVLPERPDGHGYQRPPRDLTRYVPDYAGELLARTS